VSWLEQLQLEVEKMVLRQDLHRFENPNYDADVAEGRRQVWMFLYGIEPPEDNLS